MGSETININVTRRRREEALRRRAHRERASRLDGLRPRFQQWMRDQGMPEAQQRAELERLQEHVDFNELMAEEGDVE